MRPRRPAVATSSVPIVVGSGIAGLSTALGLGRCIVVTKTALGAGSSEWAQGGIAAAFGAGDDPAQHAADTVAVGAGLVDESVARLVAAAGPDRIRWLRRLGVQFDQNDAGFLHMGREAGHGRNRIVHADGDATGREVMRALRHAVNENPQIEVRERAHVIDLARAGSRIVGAVMVDAAGRHEVVLAPAVVLATGGIGRIYARTTNPVEATGDGLAVAIRAGAVVRDVEFVQFHPTALAGPADPLPLLTEALRGAGAALVDGTGRRFMAGLHPDGDLAPRDVVARSVWSQLTSEGGAFLDTSGIGAEFESRFPSAFGAARAAGLDPTVDLLPVTPAAHYHMGGIATDVDGRTSLSGLYACGEVAATGLHGANRLASNSLLEALVFAVRVSAAVWNIETPLRLSGVGIPISASIVGGSPTSEIEEMRTLMWRHVGLVRDGRGLTSALDRFEALAELLGRSTTGRNLMTVARLVTAQALAREESRGSHFRSDHPLPASPRHAMVSPKPVDVFDLESDGTIHAEVA